MAASRLARRLFIGLLLSLLVCGYIYKTLASDDLDQVVFEPSATSTLKFGVARPRRYFLYEINPGEGFNLRRDVYMRIANLVKMLREVEDWVLVLPPWGNLYHWQTEGLQQKRIAWSSFFDLVSLNRHVSVMEMEDFLNEIGEPVIDEIYYLQSYKEGWSDGKWEEKIDERECIDTPRYRKNKDGHYKGRFWNYDQIYALNFKCLSVQGHVRIMKPLLLEKSKARTVLIDRFEELLHNEFGDKLFWEARRSMRFSKHLRDLGDEFRKTYLNSVDDLDQTLLTEDWREMKVPEGTAFGGPYVGIHLRRKDFLYGHEKDVPSIEGAAKKVIEILDKLNLTSVFIATDAPDDEVQEFKKLIPQAVKYTPSQEVLEKYKDGGVAIIDQWICAHARYFIGTAESTFSFRIQEEREILGFYSDTTFNRFCPDSEETCEQPSRWRIVY